jgi:hypothetical protein
MGTGATKTLKKKTEENLEEIALIDPGHVRRDLRQLESAISRGWDIPDLLLKQLPLAMAKIVKEGSRREATNATRVIVAMQRQNVPQMNLHAHQHQAGEPGSSAPKPEPTKSVEGMTFEQQRNSLLDRVERVALHRGNSGRP